MKIVKFIQETFKAPLTVTITKKAAVERDRLLVKSAAITSVTNADEQKYATEIARDIRTIVKTVSAFTLQLTKPLREAVATINGVKDDYIDALNVEQARLEKQLSAYVVEDRKRVAEANMLEAEKLRAANEEAERLRQEADKKMAELAKASNPEDLQEAYEKECAAIDAREAAERAVRTHEPEAETKTKGTSYQTVVRWKVTDIAELYKTRPDLVRMEPRAGVINQVCFPFKQDSTEAEPDRSIPGLEMWYELDTRVRSR